MKLLTILPIVMALIIGAIVTFAPATTVLAQQVPETGVGGLVTCSGSYCTFCDFVAMGNRVLDWLFGLVFSIFAVVAFISGVKLVTAGGNSGQLDAAKKSLTNVLIGVLIMFSAWLIVDTLMRAAVNVGGEGNLGAIGPWNNIDCGRQNQTQQGSGLGSAPSGGVTPIAASPGCVDQGDGTERCTQTIYGATPPPDGYTCTPAQGSMNSDRQNCVLIRPLGGGGGTVPPGSGCLNCSTYASANGVTLNGGGTMPFNANPCNGQATCYVNETMVNRLSGMGNQTSGWQISEAWPPFGYSESDPTGVHASACHGTATCIDVSRVGVTPTAAEISSFTNSARQNNLTVVYEVPSETRAAALRSAGVTNVIVVSGINREHFSVYMCDVDSSPNACGG